MSVPTWHVQVLSLHFCRIIYDKLYFKTEPVMQQTSKSTIINKVKKFHSNKSKNIPFKDIIKSKGANIHKGREYVSQCK